MDQGSAQKLVNIISSVVSQQTETGAGIDYQYGVASTSSSDEISAYLSGDEENITDAIQVPSGMFVSSGDYIFVALDRDGHRWVEHVLAQSLYAKLAMDSNAGILYSGDGLSEPTDVFVPTLQGMDDLGVATKQNLADHADDYTHLHPLTTPNSLTTFSGEWSRIAYGQIDERYGSASATMLIGGGGGVSAQNPRGTVRFGIHQAVAVGGNPSVVLETVAVSSIDPTDFNIVILDNSGPVTFELYVRITTDYTWVEYVPLFANTDRALLVWTQCEDFVGSLPSHSLSVGGTAVATTAAIYGDPVTVLHGGTGGTTQTAARAGLGSTVIGDALFVAANAAAATALLSNLVGDSGSGGTKGLVPAPASGDAAASKFLKADGTWAVTSGGGQYVSATDPGAVGADILWFDTHADPNWTLYVRNKTNTGWTEVVTSVDTNYLHTQGSASSTWNVAHNLNRYPAVTVMDSAHTQVEGSITHTDTNNLVITFGVAFSGSASCN